MAQVELAGSPKRNGRVPVAEPGAQNGGAPQSRLTRALQGLAEQARRRLPRPELEDRDPDFIREQLPLLWLIATLWFRAEVRGLGNVPDEGPVLLVGNHSGGSVSPDTALFTLAFNTYFGVERRFHALAPRLGMPLPAFRWLRRFGTVPAGEDVARRALRAGAAVLAYPGGGREAHRPSWQSGRVDLGRDTGYIRLALEEHVPIVPVVAIGGQETALFLSRGEGLARLLRLDRLAALERLPLSLSLPWLVNVGDVLGHLPLPAKITIETLPAVEVREEFGTAPDLDEVHHHVTAVMQDTLDALGAERRLPLVG